MNVRKLLRLGAATVLSLSSLLVSTAPLAHAAGTTLYWCNIAGGNFNTAANWNTNSDCSSGTAQVPANTDDLVFDNTNLTSDVNADNDMTGLDVNSISFTGASGFEYTISGNALSVDAGIAGSASTIGVVDVDVTITADQSFDYVQIGAGTGTTLTIGTNNLTLGPTGFVDINEAVSGSGNIEVGPGGAFLGVDSPAYSGTTTIDSDASLEVLGVDTGDPLGTGDVVVTSGGSLILEAAGDIATVPNDMSIEGNGLTADPVGALSSCLGDNSGCQSDGSDTQLIFTGTITLTGDAQVANNVYDPNQTSAPAHLANFTFNGTITANGHNLTVPANSNTAINGSAAGSFATGGSSSGSGSGSDSTSGTTTPAPKTPDTGLAAFVGNPLTVITATLGASAALTIAARRFNLAKH